MDEWLTEQIDRILRSDAEIMRITEGRIYVVEDGDTSDIPCGILRSESNMEIDG